MVFNMILAPKKNALRKAVIWKLPQISRLAGKSLLCNVSMNTCLDDRASGAGSVISVGTLATSHYAVVHNAAKNAA